MWFAVGGVSIIMIERFDNIMTGFVLSSTAITILVITRKLFDISKSFIFQLNNNFRPYFGKMIAQAENKILIQKFNNLSVISVCLASFVGGGIVILNEFFIDLWVGKDKYGGGLLSLLLFFNLVFHSWKITYRAFLSSNLVAKELAISSFIEGVFNVILAYFLALRYGLLGIVASTFISGFIVNSFVFVLINNKYKFESSQNLFKRNINQIFLVIFLALSSYLISSLFSSLFVKLLFWVLLVIICFFLIKHIFFRTYSYMYVLNGKVL
jgi:O-antigen/teichoic acid export membrane protein